VLPQRICIPVCCAQHILPSTHLPRYLLNTVALPPILKTRFSTACPFHFRLMAADLIILLLPYDYVIAFFNHPSAVGAIVSLCILEVTRESRASGGLILANIMGRIRHSFLWWSCHFWLKTENTSICRYCWDHTDSQRTGGVTECGSFQYEIT
jgi:hypothetical protein